MTRPSLSCVDQAVSDNSAEHTQVISMWWPSLQVALALPQVQQPEQQLEDDGELPVVARDVVDGLHGRDEVECGWG